MAKPRKSPPPMHPGKYLDLEILPPLREQGLQPSDIAIRAGLARDKFNQLLRGAVDLTPETALRLGKVLGLEPGSLLRMQADFSLWRCDAAIGDQLAELKPIAKPARKPKG